MDAPFFMEGVSAGETLTTRFQGLILPIFLRLADVSLVADLSHLLSLGEELLTSSIFVN